MDVETVGSESINEGAERALRPVAAAPDAWGPGRRSCSRCWGPVAMEVGVGGARGGEWVVMTVTVARQPLLPLPALRRWWQMPHPS